MLLISLKRVVLSGLLLSKPYFCNWDMHTLKVITLAILIIGASLFADDNSQSQSSTKGNWFLKNIHIPENIAPKSRKKKIVIAVADDGVRITHQDLKDFIWTNPKEIPNNIDDDGNGCVDDVHGWDAADKDNTVTPPQNRLKDFCHGTHLAGIVAQVAQATYGSSAADFIQIMPVKCLEDNATRTYLKYGYAGVEYAVKAGADIIICAWSVGYISPHESRLLEEAHKKGILIVASAGNFPEEREQYPAAHDSVLGVAALDQEDKKTNRSNYGSFVDLSAPGIDISSTSVLSDTDYEIGGGSSCAAAMVAATAAIVKLQHPSYSLQQIRACLKSSADVIDVIDPQYGGKLGAGKLNIEGAVESALFNKHTKEENQLFKPQGYLRYHHRKKKSAAWTINPDGLFKGFRFKAVSIKGKAGDSILRFYSNNSTDSKLLASYPLSKLPEDIYVPGTTVYVTFDPKKTNRKLDWLLEYRVETIDLRKLYCDGTKYLNEEGSFEDGSGPEDYSAHCDCKWLITAPEGKVIHIKFAEFDTEANTDLLYFFNGSGTHEKIMAIFSGPNIPRELTTWRNQVLVWFVTDGQNQGKGWKAEYRFENPPG